jgi:hypothetical protein
MNQPYELLFTPIARWNSVAFISPLSMRARILEQIWLQNLVIGISPSSSKSSDMEMASDLRLLEAEV